jgi:hypothetical protein
MKERRGRDVRQGIRKGRQERLQWKTGETGLENRIGRDGKTEEAGTEDRIAGKEEELENMREMDERQQRRGWNTGEAVVEDRKAGWKKREAGMDERRGRDDK